ncbi:hypothetical protein G3I44_15070 [Halogeometricum borinquense]|uniref:DUF7344 domain-containing protein n=1 Tax=Halogeometricum borinquense TaxID=60847 RepID=A0A6C0UK10_9EURY|nr:hypothetical protein [Halogeometricum borinquense]QIB75500.1 hypothetical protein G3I44_15070 [Halogeometricum borinquense]
MGGSGPGTLLTEQSDDDDELHRDEIFDLISNRRRRYAIRYCKEATGPVSLSDLAEHVAAWEHEKTVEEITSRERKSVYTSLQQTHLPRLDRAGIIEFEDGEVELTDRIQSLDIYLDIVPENSVSWGVYYLGLSVLSCVIIAALWLEILPTDSIPMLVYPTLIVVLFTVSAVYHTVDNYRYRFDEIEQE